MQLYWKVYFGIYAVLALVGGLGAALRPSALTLVDWIDLLAFTPVALTALWAQAFGRSLLPETIWKVLLFSAVFWKSIAVGITAPKVAAQAVDLNSRMGVGIAEASIVVALITAAFVIGPTLFALYCKGYPDGDRAHIRLPARG